MDGRGRTFFLLQVFFCFFVFASTEEIKQIKPVPQKEIEDCSQVQCPGPLIYYNGVGCTPVYKNEGDCCAYKYNCDHLDARSPNKCYVKHRSYEVGEFVSREYINMCDITCVCAAGEKSAGFWCLFSHYDYYPPFDNNCYLKRNIHECGPGTIICPKNESEIPQCVVRGRTFRGGEIFAAGIEPLKVCICQEGYTGDNIEPFCTEEDTTCLLQAFPNEEIVNKNAPVFHENSPIKCPFTWRRQNANDTVIPNPNGPTASEENSVGGEDLTCKFGNLTMNIGDKLTRRKDSDSKCAECVCEVPPTPTCRYLGFDARCKPA